MRLIAGCGLSVSWWEVAGPASSPHPGAPQHGLSAALRRDLQLVVTPQLVIPPEKGAVGPAPASWPWSSSSDHGWAWGPHLSQEMCHHDRWGDEHFLLEWREPGYSSFPPSWGSRAPITCLLCWYPCPGEPSPAASELSPLPADPALWAGLPHSPHTEQERIFSHLHRDSCKAGSQVLCKVEKPRCYWPVRLSMLRHHFWNSVQPTGLSSGAPSMACVSLCSPFNTTRHLSCIETRVVWAPLLWFQYKCRGWGLPGWHLQCVPTGHHVSVVHWAWLIALGHLKTGIYLAHDSVGLQFCLNLPGSFCHLSR